jgi:hypothetical protein
MGDLRFVEPSLMLWRPFDLWHVAPFGQGFCGIEHDYRELKTGLGLDHFEGRSFPGWHRHVTLAVLAQAF